LYDLLDNLHPDTPTYQVGQCIPSRGTQKPLNSEPDGTELRTFALPMECPAS